MTASTAAPRVVVGVIDDGIAFAHERFRKGVGAASATRVEYWWLQDGGYQGVGSPVPYGRELAKAAIDPLLTACTQAGILDEDLFYRQAGLIDFRQEGHKSAAWREAHGTHVMDLACGFDPLAPRDDRPIVCVQLPIRVTADTSGASLYPYVLDAMTYILDRAVTISGGPGAPQLPVVINLSYGRLEGPHDGTLDLEDAIEHLVAQSAKRGVRLRVVLPAGNSYLSRCHAQVSFRHRGQIERLPWRILPDDRTPSFLEIWLPHRRGAAGTSRIAVTITSPTGASRTIDETSGPMQWMSGGQVYAEARYVVAMPSNRGMFRISLQPTTDFDPSAALAPAGIWTVALENRRLGRRAVVHAWVQRDDSLYGFPLRGRQSYFDHSCYVRHDHAGRDKETDDPGCVVRRESTINSIATGRHPIVMGGYLRKEMVAAKYSAAGAATPPGPPPRAPDAMTASEDSRVHGGVLAAGSRSGSVVAMGGTSVAAPQITKRCAEELAAAKAGDRAAVQALAAADEAGYPPATPPKPPPERGGAGRIDLPRTSRVRRYCD